MLMFSQFEARRTLAICETRAVLSRKTRISEAFSASRGVQRIYFMQRPIPLPMRNLGGLRLRQLLDSRFGLRLMPHQHEQSDAIFQFPECATKSEFLIA